MCTFKSSTQVMVCDVSREQVRSEVAARLGDAASFETVHGQGTLVTCHDAARVPEFRGALEAALGEGAVPIGE